MAGIDLLLEGQHELKKEVTAVKEQFVVLNGSVKKLNEKEIQRTERERIAAESAGNTMTTRRELWAAAIGAGAIGSVTILLHLAGIA